MALSRLKRFLESFVHAFDGIVDATRTQPNIGVHLIVTALVLLLALALHLTLWAFIAVLLLIALVLGIELMNTAVEAIVDLASPELHPLAKKTKDAAAGAVLVVSIGAVLAGVAIFAASGIGGYVRPAEPAFDAQTCAAAVALTAVLTVLAKARWGSRFSGRATLLWSAWALLAVAYAHHPGLSWPEGIAIVLAAAVTLTRRPLTAATLLPGPLVGIVSALLCVLVHDPRML